MSIMFSPLCFSYITFFLRLDYAFANLDDASSGSLEKLPKHLAASTDGENWGGTLVPPPSSVPSFRKPYYTAAWVGYHVAILCLALLCSVPISAGLPLIRMDGCDIIGFYLVFLAPTIICIFVMAVAFRRGELAQVWAYEEKWTGPTQKAKQVDAGDACRGLPFLIGVEAMQKFFTTK